MSMKKFTKKMLAIVAAGAMTMGLAMPAFAADPSSTTPDTKNNAKEAYIKKTYNTEVKKPMEFTFTATQVKTGDYIVTKDLTCTIPSIKFETSDFASEAGTYTKLSEKITFGTLEEAGKYEYNVTETASDPAISTTSGHEKLIMSGAEYKMDVYVVEKAGKLEIDKILVNKTKNDQGTSDSETGKVDIGNDLSKNGFNFVNTYAQEAGTGTDPVNPGTDPDVDYTNNGSLKVSKTINAQEGTASTTDSVSFTATFVFPKGTGVDTLGAKAGENKLVLDTDGTYKFDLKDGQNMKFTGLPVGTKITVTEAGAANYKASAKVFLNGVEKTPAPAASKYNELLKAVGQEKLGQKKNTVDVTNTYNYVPTTGIIMNTLPYVLMVALCAAALFGFVAFKRKKVQK